MSADINTLLLGRYRGNPAIMFLLDIEGITAPLFAYLNTQGSNDVITYGLKKDNKQHILFIRKICIWTFIGITVLFLAALPLLIYLSVTNYSSNSEYREDYYAELFTNKYFLASVLSTVIWAICCGLMGNTVASSRISKLYFKSHPDANESWIINHKFRKYVAKLCKDRSVEDVRALLAEKNAPVKKHTRYKH